MTNIMDLGKNPNYLGSYDLYDVPLHEITVTIKRFCEEDVVTNGKTDKCAVCYFEENYKPMIINLTNKKTLAKLFKTIDGEKIKGKQITICSEQVKAFGKIHDALRIKQTLPPQKTANMPKCECCGGDITPANNMTSAQVSEYTKQKYGKSMCASCARKAAKNAAE